MHRELFTAMIDADRGGVAHHQHPLAYEPIGHRVEGLLELHPPIRAHRGLFEYHRVPSRGRKGSQGGQFFLFEDLQWAAAHFLHDVGVADLSVPPLKLLAQLIDAARRLASLFLSFSEEGQEIALDVFHVGFHSSFQLGACRRAGGDKKSVVLGQASVGAIDQGVLKGGPHDGSLQVIGHHLAWSPRRRTRKR